MGCEFKESISETIAPKRGAYTEADMRSMVDNLVGGLLRELDTFKKAIPPKTDEGRVLKTTLTTTPKLRKGKLPWKGSRLSFVARLLVEAKAIFWFNAIDVEIRGDIVMKSTKGIVDNVKVNVLLEFEAMEDAMKTLKKKLSVADCKGVQLKLRKNAQQHLTRVRDSAKRGVKDTGTAASK